MPRDRESPPGDGGVGSLCADGRCGLPGSVADRHGPTNKAFILDLAPGQKIDDYALRFMPDCISSVQEDSGEGDVTLVGYCAGGMISSTYTAVAEESLNLERFIERNQIIRADVVASGFAVSKPVFRAAHALGGPLGKRDAPVAHRVLLPERRRTAEQERLAQPGTAGGRCSCGSGVRRGCGSPRRPLPDHRA